LQSSKVSRGSCTAQPSEYKLVEHHIFLENKMNTKTIPHYDCDHRNVYNKKGEIVRKGQCHNIFEPLKEDEFRCYSFELESIVQNLKKLKQ
jgi:hypothetical protein